MDQGVNSARLAAHLLLAVVSPITPLLLIAVGMSVPSIFAPMAAGLLLVGGTMAIRDVVRGRRLLATIGAGDAQANPRGLGLHATYRQVLLDQSLTLWVLFLSGAFGLVAHHQHLVWW